MFLQVGYPSFMDDYLFRLLPDSVQRHTLIKKALIELATNFGSGPTLEKLSNQGSAEERQLAQKGLENLEAQRPVLVNQMFDEVQATRIAATTRLIQSYGKDPKVVTESLTAVNKNLSNRSGVINTLLLFQTIDPSILKAHSDEITTFLNAVMNYGPQAKEHTSKVRALLKTQAEIEPTVFVPATSR